MNRLLKRVGVFLTTFKGCVSGAWEDSDRHYHIPKSRFNSNSGEKDLAEASPPKPKAPARNYFLGSFRDCLLSAWKASDENYHIPKTRFMDKEYNQTAYRNSTGPGLWSHIRRFFWTLRHCISMSWEASETFYYLPKSRYQEADFIKDLMKVAPDAKGKLLYRPYMIGRGFVMAETIGRGWRVGPMEEKVEELDELYIPPMDSGLGEKLELEM